jgi:uncharacterized protein (TIGR04222 family)
MLAVALLGLVRVLAEIAEARPVGLLLLVLPAVTVVALVQLTRAPRRSRGGDRALAALRAEHRALAPERAPDLRGHGPAGAALGIGLFGTEALAAAAPGFAREVEPCVETEDPPGRNGTLARRHPGESPVRPR